MSGIVGIFNLDGAPVDSGLLQRMSNTIAHRGPDGEGHWIEGAVGLSCQLMRVTPESLTETQPTIYESGAVIVFDGRLDNREELLAELNGSPRISASSSDPSLILSAYELFGDRFPEHLNGDFALGLFDPKQQRLILVRDSIGVRPLYYCQTGRTFLFASEIKAILTHPQVTARPNDEMLAAFLIANRAQDCHGMTFFEGVSSLRPSYAAIVTRHGFATRQYWDFDFKKQVRFRSFPEYAEAFREHFETAVRRRLRSAYPVAVSLSGGLDSSSIFCTTESLRRRKQDSYPRVFGFSYISPAGSPSDEDKFLVDIEKQYGVSVKRSSDPFPGFVDSAEYTRSVEVPLFRGQLNGDDPLVATIRQAGARVLLTGHYGDQMLDNQAYFVDLVRRFKWNKALSHLKEYKSWTLDADPMRAKQLFLRNLVAYHLPHAIAPVVQTIRGRMTRSPERSSWYTKAFQRKARSHISKRIFNHGIFIRAHSRSLYDQARSMYHVLCMESSNKAAASLGYEMAYPFLDRDLISLLMYMPGEMECHGGVQKGILREAMREILPTSISQRRWKADFTDLGNEDMERDYPQLAHMLQSSKMAIRLGYADEDLMEQELIRLKSQLRRSDCLVTWRLQDLLGLEFWLQVFFGNRNDADKKEMIEYARSF